MSADLLYSIGLDVSDLKTSAVAAKEQADEIKKGFKGFKDVLEFGGVGAAVYGFFSSVIDYAKELKGELDENQRAVKNFGEGLTTLKTAGMELGVKVIGTFNRLGEAIGDAINIARSGWSSWARDQELLEITAAAAAEAERRRDEVKKQNGEELKKITDSLLELKKQEQALALQGLTKQETLNNLTNDYLRIGIQIANGGNDKLKQRQLELELAQAHLAMGKAELDVRKEDAALAEKAAEQEEKDFADVAKSANALLAIKAKEVEYARSKLSTEEQAQLLTTEKLDLEKQLLEKGISFTKETEIRTRLLEVTKNLDEIAVDNASERLDLEEQITAQKEEQVAIISSGPGYQSQSTNALQGMRQRAASNLDAAIANDFGKGYNEAGHFTDPAIEQFRAQLAKIDAELSMRRTVQNYAQRFGEDAAVRQYGDEMTQRAFKDMATSSTRTQNAVENISTTLGRIFPRS